MVQIAVVNNNTLAIHTMYENDTVQYNRFKCKMNNIIHFTHVINETLPLNINQDFLIAYRDEESNIIVSLNTEKYNTFIEDQLQQKINNIKYTRNKLLLDSDWTQLPDVQLTQAEIDECKVYRQELRDLNMLDVANDIIGYPTVPNVLS